MEVGFPESDFDTKLFVAGHSNSTRDSRGLKRGTRSIKESLVVGGADFGEDGGIGGGRGTLLWGGPGCPRVWGGGSVGGGGAAKRRLGSGWGGEGRPAREGGPILS